MSINVYQVEFVIKHDDGTEVLSYLFDTKETAEMQIDTIKSMLRKEESTRIVYDRTIRVVHTKDDVDSIYRQVMNKKNTKH